MSLAIGSRSSVKSIATLGYALLYIVKATIHRLLYNYQNEKIGTKP